MEGRNGLPVVEAADDVATPAVVAPAMLALKLSAPRLGRAFFSGLPMMLLSFSPGNWLRPKRPCAADAKLPGALESVGVALSPAPGDLRGLSEDSGSAECARLSCCGC